MLKTNIATKPSKGNRKFKNIIAIMVVITILSLTFTGCTRKQKDYKEYFVEYDNASTLVVIRYGEESFWAIYYALGFIDNDIYNQYKDNKYQGKIEIYHPYKKGQSITIDTNDIVEFQTMTYEDFYNEHPPK